MKRWYEELLENSGEKMTGKIVLVSAILLKKTGKTKKGKDLFREAKKFRKTEYRRQKEKFVSIK